MNYNYGTYPTMITPYKTDGSVDLETAQRYVEWYFQKGCDGIFAICQSSEIFFLTLDERIKLCRAVIEKRDELYEKYGRRMTIVASGHISNSFEEQVRELSAIAAEKPDALILITNRFCSEGESDDVWISNAEKLISMLPSNIGLGLYECPYPYKRLVTEKTLKWAISKNRFYFMKDTCCDASEIRKRLSLLSGTHFKLLNANCQTLLESLRDGGAGYCGIMANYHPELYVWLCKNYDKHPEKASLVGNLLCISGFTEVGITYPLTAKYHMNLEGIPTEVTARNRKGISLSDYEKNCTEQLRKLCSYFINNIINEK